MITLNVDKELVRIENWEDVESRPGFVTDLDPESAELDAIIGSYVLSDDIKCGLTTCHQPHRKGYLVATKDGRETNIGHICGKSNFSVEFETLRRQFNRDVRIKAQREALLAFQSRIPEFESKVEDLRHEDLGADWVHKEVTAIRTPGQELPERARHELLQMARDGHGRIERQRQATEQEIEDEEAISDRTIARPHYITEQVGTVEGIQVLYESNDLRKLVVVDLEKGLERLASLDVSAASEHVLAVESKWAGEVELKIEKAESIVAAGRRFLTASNLSQLQALLDEPQEQKALKKVVNRLPDG